MNDIPPDPLSDGGVGAYGAKLRSGSVTATEVVGAYLERIEAIDPKITALEFVAGDAALEAARNVDLALARGEDRGALMGVPVLLKDLIAVDGMPLTAGSRVDVSDLVGAEGSFVALLRRAGCILLGKCKTAEFARGGSGISRARGTPSNPWDAGTKRVTGGSSSGSAAAMAAGFAGFTIGTDTGGSVRVPAALCGLFGHKTTFGLWQLDGIYPNAHSFDSVGPLCRSAADGAFVFSALTGQSAVAPPTLAGMRFGKPTNHFFDGLADEVRDSVEEALAIIAHDGAEIVPVDVPEAGERVEFVDILCTSEFIGNFGRERFEHEMPLLDPLTVARASIALSIPATEYVRMQRRQRVVQNLYAARLAQFDAWLTPTVRVVAPEVAPALGSVEATIATEAPLGINTHLISYFGLCATTTPLQMSSKLPVGLQTICGPGGDRQALSIALRLEQLFGLPRQPDLSGF